MYAEEHYTILNSGVDAWNRWRNDNPQIRPNLESVDLSSGVLNGIKFDHTDLPVAVLRGASLQESIFEATNLSGADLTAADLRRAWFPGADLRVRFLDR